MASRFGHRFAFGELARIERAAYGTFDGLALDGALRLRLPNGRIERVHAGDVALAKRSGER